MAGCVAAEEEAEELLAAAPDPATLEAWVRRREVGEPLAWIIGSTTFCGRKVLVDSGVYEPRLQSEELARRAAALRASSGGRALDVCTGAGSVAVAIGAVAAVDVDARAVACARRNGVAAVQARVEQLPFAADSFDVVTAVAPYVPSLDVRLLPADVQRYEPRLALDGGADGLEVVRRIVQAATRLLRTGGWLLLELGGVQDRLLAPALAAGGFGETTVWRDEDGDLRGLATRRASR